MCLQAKLSYFYVFHFNEDFDLEKKYALKEQLHISEPFLKKNSKKKQIS